MVQSDGNIEMSEFKVGDEIWWLYAPCSSWPKPMLGAYIRHGIIKNIEIIKADGWDILHDLIHLWIQSPDNMEFIVPADDLTISRSEAEVLSKWKDAMDPQILMRYLEKLEDRIARLEEQRDV